ncbi:MAG: hypothetical protein M3Y49_09900 [Actinomycetota bacterium]|nr:hypothetical protein [Actinomycetota bacterium]
MVQIETPQDSSFEQWLRLALDQTPLPDELQVRCEDVTASGHRILGRHQIARRALIGLAAAAVIGVSVPLLNGALTTGHHNTTSHAVGHHNTTSHAVTAGSCAGTPVIDATGTQRVLIVSAPHTGKVDIRLFPSVDCEQNPSQHPTATDTLSSPAPGRAVAGQVSGMPYYLVNGNPTSAAVNGIAATIVRSIGNQSVIWPVQSAPPTTGHKPSTITWTIGSATFTQQTAAQ